MMRAVRLLSIVSLALVLGGGLVWWARRPSVRSLERQIKKELPLGSNSAEVVSFLVARRIEHSDLITGTSHESFYLPDGRRVSKRFIAGVIHNRYILFPAEERITLIFYFDEGDSLIDYDTRSHQIAP
jgi:hypothetical protein